MDWKTISNNVLLAGSPNSLSPTHTHRVPLPVLADALQEPPVYWVKRQRHARRQRHDDVAIVL